MRNALPRATSLYLTDRVVTPRGIRDIVLCFFFLEEIVECNHRTLCVFVIKGSLGGTRRDLLRHCHEGLSRIDINFSSVLHKGVLSVRVNNWLRSPDRRGAMQRSFVL